MNITMTHTGLLTAVGATSKQSIAAERARIQRFRELSGLHFCRPIDADIEDGEPVCGATLSYLDAQRKNRPTPAEWLAYLAGLAFADMESDAILKAVSAYEIGVFIAVPSPRPGWGREHEQEFIYHFHNTIKFDVFPRVTLSYLGHAGGLVLLNDALQQLRAGTIRYALLGGTESYFIAEWLDGLDQQYRLKSARNIDGFIPGEAAAFVLLERDSSEQSTPSTPRVNVKAVRVGSGNPQASLIRTGSCLSELLDALLRDHAESPWIVCDLNGESARMNEWAYAVVRLGRVLGTPVMLEHPATSFGDIGAASGVASLIVAAHRLQRQIGLVQRSSAVVWSASDSGERAAAFVHVTQ